MSTPDPQQAAKERIDKLIGIGTPDALALADQLGQAFGVKFDKPMPPKPQGLPDAPAPKPAEAAPSGPTLGDVEGNKPPKTVAPKAPAKKEIGKAQTAQAAFEDFWGMGFQDVDPMEAGKALRAKTQNVMSSLGSIAGIPVEPAYQTQPVRGVGYTGPTTDLSQPITNPGPVTAANRQWTRESRAANPNTDLAAAAASIVPALFTGAGEEKLAQEGKPLLDAGIRGLRAIGKGATAGGAYGGTSALGHGGSAQDIAQGAEQGAETGGVLGAAGEMLMSPLRAVGNAIWDRMKDPAKNPAGARMTNMAEMGGVEPSLTAKGGLKPSEMINQAYEKARAEPELTASYIAQRDAAPKVNQALNSIIERGKEYAATLKQAAYAHSPIQSAEPLYERWKTVYDKGVFEDGTPIPFQAVGEVRSALKSLLEKVKEETPNSHAEAVKNYNAAGEQFGTGYRKEMSPEELGTAKTEMAMQAPPADVGVTQAKGKGKKAQREAGRIPAKGDEIENTFRDLTAEQVDKIRAGLAKKAGDYGVQGKSSQQQAMKQLLALTQDYIGGTGGNNFGYFPNLHRANQMSSEPLGKMHNELEAMGLPRNADKLSVEPHSADIRKTIDAIQNYSVNMPLTDAMKSALNQDKTTLDLVRRVRAITDYEQLVTKGGSLTASVNSNLTPVIRLGDIGKPLMRRAAGLKNLGPVGTGTEMASRSATAARQGDNGEATGDDAETLAAMFHLGNMEKKK